MLLDLSFRFARLLLFSTDCVACGVRMWISEKKLPNFLYIELRSGIRPGGPLRAQTIWPIRAHTGGPIRAQTRGAH